MDEFEQVAGGGDLDHAEEALGELVVACSNGSVDLEMTEHALDAIALLVEDAVVDDRLLAVRAARDDGVDPAFAQIVANGIGVILCRRVELLVRPRAARSTCRTPYSRRSAHRSDGRRAVARRYQRGSESYSRTRPASGQEPVDESPFYPRCRYVGADGGAIDAVVAGARHHLGQGNGHALPYAGLAPTPKAPIDRVPVAELLRHVAPGSTAT